MGVWQLGMGVWALGILSAWILSTHYLQCWWSLNTSRETRVVSAFSRQAEREICVQSNFWTSYVCTELFLLYKKNDMLPKKTTLPSIKGTAYTIWEVLKGEGGGGVIFIKKHSAGKFPSSLPLAGEIP